MGAVFAVVQKNVRRGADLLKRRLLVDLEINNKDDSYASFLYWMSTHQQAQVSNVSKPPANLPKSRKSGVLDSLLSRFTPGLHHLSIETIKNQLPNGSIQTSFALIPGPGKHIIRYKNSFILIDRVRETKSLNHQDGRPWETVTLTTLYAQREKFGELLTEAHELIQRHTEGKTIIYRARMSEWERFGEPRRKRPIESVVLDKGLQEKIVSDIKDFLRSGNWYLDRGVPYRRGYLLHGPPGSGKSSFIQALAGKLEYNIAMVNLSERGMTDDRLTYLLTKIPRRTLVLLEDADAAFANRRKQDADGYQGNTVTFSGLLNALDGIVSAEERLMFLTTNHIDRLDDALVRPGRVDMIVRIGEATRWQADNLWDRFYGDLDQEGSHKARFLERLEHLGLIEQHDGKRKISGRSTSAAALQGLFIYNKSDMESAISMAESLLVPAEVRPSISNRDEATL